MIVLIKDGAKEEQVRQLIERLESFRFQVARLEGGGEDHPGACG